MVYEGVGALAVVILLGVWFARFRLTKVVIPSALTPAVESESFRDWLGECPYWLMWGREEDGSYYAVAHGWVGARAVIRKAKDLDRP